MTDVDGGKVVVEDTAFDVVVGVVEATSLLVVVDAVVVTEVSAAVEVVAKYLSANA